MTAYVGIDGKARNVKSAYIGVDGVARKVKAAYIGVDGVAHLWWKEAPILIPASNAAVGSYISYTAGGCSSWRVLFNNSGQLDIVSAGSVEDITLSGNSGYCNCVQTLNNAAAGYMTGFATGARSIGCTSSSQATISVGSNQASLSSAPYTDTYYVTDFNQLVNNGLVQSDKEVWLASRVDANRESVLGQLVSSDGAVRTITTSGTLDYWSLQTYSKAGLMNDRSITKGFRPVVSLQSGLYIAGGSGAASDPYVLTT